MKEIKNGNGTQRKKQLRLYAKIGFIVLLIILMMVPNALIQNLIRDRQGLERQTRAEIASSWGPAQNIVGPVLSIPYTEKSRVVGSKKIKSHILRILPTELNIDVNVVTHERKRNIYTAILYNGQHQMQGRFKLPGLSDFGPNVETILWENASIDIGFTAAASLDEVANLTIDGVVYGMKSGASNGGVYPTAIHTNIALGNTKQDLNFECEFGINGSRSLKYVPIADNSKITMRSDWSSPGFQGLPLPQNREVTDEGFTAQWNTTEYNRSFKNMWSDNDVNLYDRNLSFGVDLVQTVGHYQKNMRSAKYALLIISLSFMMFFFFEILKGSAIHPVQYIFVGLSLSIFYSLLLSLSEHIGFALAYLVASVHVVGLIGWYSRYIFMDRKSVLILTGTLSGLYGYIYTLLQMEEFALIVGSLGLFGALATAMYLSRSMDWYKMQMRPETDDLPVEKTFV